MPIPESKQSLAEKNILITGGTSRLGEHFVRKAIASGAQVFFTYHKNQQLAEELAQAGGRPFLLDLSDSRAIDDFVRNIRGEIKKLDGIVHNAAAVRDGFIHQLSEEEWDYVLAVNLKAPYYLTKGLLPLLWKANPAKILILISRLAVTGGAGVSNYAAAKAGLIGLVKSLAQEVGRKQILVNGVNPGFMISSMTHSLLEKELQKQKEGSLLGKFSDPEEVADFLVYLCSDQMTRVTGQIFHFESRKI